MPFDFDRLIERRGTHANKWDGMQARTGVSADDGIAMWVADMDFACPPSVQARLSAAAAHGVYGYYGNDSTWRAAVCGWMGARHDWEVDPDWLSVSPGVCAAIAYAIMGCSEPGEGIVLFPPVYHAFARVIRSTGRRVVDAPLVTTQGRYEMDLETLGRELPADARVVILCSPHNPGGRIWEPAELAALGRFCAERDLILISDEVWHDLILPGGAHTIAAKACPEIADRLITCAAPSKTFNLAGGSTAEVIIADPALRERYRRAADAAHGLSSNLFGMLAAEEAYLSGAPWLDELIVYLAKNRDLFQTGLAAAVPAARMMTMPSTYLAWVDFSGTGLGQEEIARRLREDARIGVNDGPTFGVGGEGWARFNLACPASVVETAVARLGEAFADRR
jgi:cystathionine beta-lyase